MTTLLRRLLLAIALIAIPALPHAQAPARPQTAAAAAPTIAVADYTRAVGLAAKYDGLVVDAPDAPTWMTGDKFWYRKSTRGGFAFVVVDPTTMTKKPAFDHARLATGLSAAAAKMYTANDLPFTTFAFVQGESAITFTTDDNTPWTCALSTYTCVKGATAPPAGANARGGGAGAGGGGRAGGFPGRGGQGGGAPGVSPDGKTAAFIRDNNIYLRAADAAPETGVAVSTTGTADHPFALNNVLWSPDSKKIAASRITVPAAQHMVRYVESSPTDQVQPKTFERNYPKPGDALAKEERIFVDVAAKRALVIDPKLFDNPYSIGRMRWRDDSRSLTFDYNQRGHQVVRVIEVNGTTGVARALIDETSKAFIDYRTANGALADSGRSYRLDMNDGKEILWMSERDGWAHLYLYDGLTGAVKNQVTKGNWLVRAVVRVDEAARQIWFMAGGMNPKQDPYFAQYYRINFDGTGLTPLTDADGNHAVSFSPDNQFYVDTWSRVDLAPVSQLRRSSDQKIVMDLEKGDATALVAAGWKAPEVFVAKGRDGVTDIWGVIIRPTRFDPTRKYPVIENIYAGPQGSFVPKSFSSYYGMQSLAEMGFIVVQIDGMGTANRSKAFHDTAFKNIGDAGFPDRILWHQAAAKKYPASYDLTRVGIYGGSAGGQNSLGGMLFHPEFYKAAVSFAGCHDNRMDKMWWNEQWMSWPIGPEYAASSNVVNAGKLQGKLMLVVGELDTNVDPSSTMQVVNALIKAGKQFDLLVMPGEDHPAGRRGPSAPYGDRKMWDFFVTNLIGAKTPNWNSVPAPAVKTSHLIGDGGLGVWGVDWNDIEHP